MLHQFLMILQTEILSTVTRFFQTNGYIQVTYFRVVFVPFWLCERDKVSGCISSSPII